jgi:hypothetical protein
MRKKLISVRVQLKKNVLGNEKIKIESTRQDNLILEVKLKKMSIFEFVKSVNLKGTTWWLGLSFTNGKRKIVGTTRS